MGPLDAELVMHAGDVLFLRSGTPHQVETVGDYSLHLSFDLCDRAAGIETVFDLLLKHYDRDSLRPYGTASEVLEKKSPPWAEPKISGAKSRPYSSSTRPTTKNSGDRSPRVESVFSTRSLLRKKPRPSSADRIDVVGWMVAKAGIEPATHGFSVRCSTN